MEGTHAPVLVALLPIPLAVFCLFPWFIGGRTSCCDCGSAGLLLWLLSEIGRDLGKRRNRSSGRVGAAHRPRSVYGSRHLIQMSHLSSVTTAF